MGALLSVSVAYIFYMRLCDTKFLVNRQISRILLKHHAILGKIERRREGRRRLEERGKRGEGGRGETIDLRAL